MRGGFEDDGGNEGGSQDVKVGAECEVDGVYEGWRRT